MSIEKFIHYIKYEKRYSLHTCKAYFNDITQFYDYISLKYSKNIELGEITFQMIRSWISSLVEAGIDTRSVNRKISTLKSYFRLMVKEKVIESNPMLKISSLKMKKKITAYIEEDDLNKLLKEGELEEEYVQVRNFLIMEILYETGIRLSELINIKEEDVNFHDLSIKVLGKRNKERIIPITNLLKSKIIFYIESKGKEIISIDKKENYLFLTKKGKKIYPKFVYRIVLYYLSKITTNKKKSPHVLRHTFATHMLNNGADLNAIKEILGHSSLSATQVYSHNTINKLKNIYKQAHPRA